MYTVKQCGVKLNPPSIVVTYVDKSNNKLRYRTMPIRNFKKNSDVADIAEQLKTNQRHRSLLSNVSQIQIEKLLLIVQTHMTGLSLDQAVQFATEEMSINPEKDLNKSHPSEMLIKLIRAKQFCEVIDRLLKTIKHRCSFRETLEETDNPDVEKAKKIMEESFEMNRVKASDAEFQYDVEVDFDQAGKMQTSEWDSETDDDQF